MIISLVELPANTILNKVFEMLLEYKSMLHSKISELEGKFLFGGNILKSIFGKLGAFNNFGSHFERFNVFVKEVMYLCGVKFVKKVRKKK